MYSDSWPTVQTDFHLLKSHHVQAKTQDHSFFQQYCFDTHLPYALCTTVQ